MGKMVDFYKGKKVFLTGHTGFKGTWMTEILLEMGAEVVGYSHKEYELFKLLKTADRIEHYLGDVCDLAKISKAMEETKPDIVIHMAAQPLVIDSYNDPVYTYNVNVMGTVNLLEAARKVDSIKTILNVTTDKVYLNREWNWGYRENEELCGYDPYSNSKSCSELVTYSFKKSFFDENPNVSVSTARSGNVIGGGDFSENRIIPDCVKYALNNEDIIIRNPNSTRPYQHVLDCLNGYLLLVMKQYSDHEFEGSYNFGPNEEDCVTTETLVNKFCEVWGDNQSYKVLDVNGPHEANFLKLDCSLAKSKLGWKPLYNVNEAIQMCVEWGKHSDKVQITKNQINEYLRRQNA